MSRLEALLWDVDGTLAETERDGHRVAFNQAFEASGVPWRWDEARYGELLRITGGRERLLFDMNTRSDAPALAEREAIARAIHARKNAIYAELVRSGGIPLREGVLALMQQCRQRAVRMGIATTTSRSNLDALMRVHLGPGWDEWFAVTVCGEDVQRKKPDPEVYLKALRALNIGPLEAVAIEDAPGGLAAARAADIPAVVTRSAYFAQAPIEGAAAVGPGLHDWCGWRPALRVADGDAGGVDLDDIEGWCAQMDTRVDALAIAIGTSHGAYKFTRKPTGDILAIERIGRIHAAVPNTHLVMHSSSSVPQEWLAIIRKYGGDIKETYGVPVEEILHGVGSGVRKINIDTDIRLAMTGAMRQVFGEQPSEFDPRKAMLEAKKAARGFVKARFEAFGCAGQAARMKPVPLEARVKRYL